MRKLLVFIGVLVLVVPLTIRFYDPGWQHEIKGVDVSHHQGPIDWPLLAGDDVMFAYIKATEGGDWTDTRFDENWQEAQAAGLITGAYHFYTLCTRPELQFENFASVAPWEPGQLPPAIDLELGGNCSDRPDPEEFRAELDIFIGTIVNNYGVRPVIYTTAHFYDLYLADDPPEVDWWIRSIGFAPTSRFDGWTFWQYYPGWKDGVDGQIDRNVLGGTEAELIELTNGLR